MKALIIASVLALSGCGTINSTVSGAIQKSVADTKTANDNYVETWKAAVCGTPVGAVYRHKETFDAVKSICEPASDEKSVSTLFR